MIVNSLPRDIEDIFRDRIGLDARIKAAGFSVYALSTRSLTNAVPNARLVGYQFVPLEDVCRTYELPLDVGAGVEVTTGVLADKVRSAVLVAGDSENRTFRSGTWELRGLRVPALYLEAVWVHSRSGGTDQVVPYSSYLPEIHEGRQYPLRTFLDIVRRGAAASAGTQAF